MNKIVLIYFLPVFLLASFGVCGQYKKFPDGVYKSFDQLQHATPAYNVPLILMENGNRKTASENEYYLRSGIDSIDKGYIKNSIYAYVKEGFVYLNCYIFGLCKGYALCETSGRYFTFYAARPCKEVTQDAISRDAMMGATALLGGVLLISEENPIEKPVYALDMDSGKVSVLNVDFLKNRLAQYHDLKEKYNNENFPYRDGVMLRYVEMLNNRIKEERE